MKKELSAGAVITHGKKFLLLHYEAGHWDFVKGKVEKGEELKDTVVRETEEETGIKNLEFIDRFEEKIHYFYKKENELVSKEVVFFLAKTKTSEVNLSHEHIGYKWLGYSEALKQLTFKNAKEILKKAKKFV